VAQPHHDEAAKVADALGLAAAITFGSGLVAALRMRETAPDARMTRG